MAARATDGLLRGTRSEAAAQSTLAEASCGQALSVAKVQATIGRDLRADAQITP